MATTLKELINSYKQLLVEIEKETNSSVLYCIIRGMDESIKRNPFETRIHEIDLIRGILMCLVVIDHIFNLLMSFNQMWMGPEHLEPFYTVYKIAYWYWTNPARVVIKYICLASFCFVSGISCAFSRNNWKRALEMIGLWFIIAVVCLILDTLRSAYNWQVGLRTMRTDFNIIGVLAWSMLIYCFVQKKSWIALLIVCVIGFALHPLCVVLSKTEWGQSFYSVPFWKPNCAISDQADFMPIFPYLGFFFGGALLSYFTYRNHKESYFKRHNWERPFCFVGRHSLIIYGLHFLVLIGIFCLVGLFIK